MAVGGAERDHLGMDISDVEEKTHSKHMSRLRGSLLSRRHTEDLREHFGRRREFCGARRNGETGVRLGKEISEGPQHSSVPRD